MASFLYLLFIILFVRCAQCYQWYIALCDHGGLLEETIEEVLRIRIMRGEVSLLGCCMDKVRMMK